MIDLQTRQVLGYSLCERMPNDLVKQAFLNAVSTCAVEKGVLFHSDAAASTPAKCSAKR